MIFLYINKLLPESMIIYCDYVRLYRVVKKNILMYYKAIKLNKVSSSTIIRTPYAHHNF